jgi:hypothetical protein
MHVLRRLRRRQPTEREASLSNNHLHFRFIVEFMQTAINDECEQEN